jgi:hypothetical protein
MRNLDVFPGIPAFQAKLSVDIQVKTVFGYNVVDQKFRVGAFLFRAAAEQKWNRN